MDSLLANYASSDDEGEAEEVSRPIPPPKLSPHFNSRSSPLKSFSFFSSLPPPRISNSSSPSPSSSLFSSLPPPKSQLPNHSLNDYKREDDGGKPPSQPPSSSIFSSLPPPKTSSPLSAPKSQSGNPSSKPSLDENPKRVVHFTLPLNPSMLKSQDPDDVDDEEDKGRKARKDTTFSSTLKTLSSMLPAPKNSLCIAPAQSLGGSRRSSLQTDAPSANCPQESKADQETGSFANYSKYGSEKGTVSGYETYVSYSAEQGVNDYENYPNDDGNWAGGVVNHVAAGSLDSTYASIPAITGWEKDNGNSFGNGSYMDYWSNVSGGATTSEITDFGRIAGKRGRTDIPTEIVEVKQDELMKNRPREDQIKSTGIAFGPAYQPAPSVKGKPSKLHKRKHQIGSLYFDLKQKEMELAERRSKGFLTKAETQAKYGW